ncbi:hypothetical protein ILUMI_06674 [Ignelater luminosus]|uniref:Ganglioside-induced differentiation-associated protein 1 n=1 Tax=Ignelater luminosus TaxID=2038154 RepID=A0A8K0GF47_IGNLU|nr:hypothetical protein ILUMI_06674 [Ignelater luminosus]
MPAAFGDGSHRINITNGLLLYYHNYSYYSQKVLMALYEKNLPFESHVVNIQKGEQYESWFLKLNPRGEVPVLQDTGKIIPDSARIIDYLEDNFSNGDTPRVIPMDQGAEVRQKVTHFRHIIDQLPVRILTMGSFFHSEFVSNWPKPPFVGPIRRLLANAEKSIPNTLRSYAEENPDARDVLLQKASIHEQKNSVFTNKDEYVQVLDQFDEVLTNVEDELASHTEGRENWWLCSNRFTVADIALTILLERLNQLGYESRFWKDGKRPHIERYYIRVKQRDSYKRTIPTTIFHVLMALHEKNLPFETRFINLQTREQYEPWYLKINPRGEVPVLQDTGKIIPDSARIIDYLEDNFNNGDIPKLIPTDQSTEIKQKVTHFRHVLGQLPIEILTMGSFFHSELVSWPKPPFVGPVRRTLANSEKEAPERLRKDAEKNPEMRDALLEKASVQEQKNSILMNKDEYVQTLEQFDEVLTNVENELASHTEGKENWWLCSDRFTVADISLTILLERLNQLGFESRFWKNGKRRHVEKYYARVKQRESYKKTIPTMLFHVKMFLVTYKKPVLIALGIGVAAVIALIVAGSIYLSMN